MMDSRMRQPFIDLLAIAVPAFLLHQLVFYLAGIDQQNFARTLVFAYSFFTGFGLLLFSILVIVKRRSFDNLGMVFLILTTAMLFAAFVVFKPILQSTQATATFEKYNFLGIFGLFLTLFTVIAVRMLKSR